MPNTLVLTLDFINDIVDPTGKIARYADRIEQHRTIWHANDVLAWGRAQGMLIAHVKVGFSANYIECPQTSPIFSRAIESGALQLGTWGTEFSDRLDVATNDSIIVKHRISAFYGTELETILRANDMQHIIVMGVATQMAVEATVRDAHDRDYLVTVISDACETIDQACQENALAFLKQIATVTTSVQLTKNTTEL